MGVLSYIQRKIVEKGPTPKQYTQKQYKAIRVSPETQANVQRISQQREVESRIRMSNQAASKYLDEKAKRNIFTRMLARTSGKGAVITRRKARYEGPGGIGYRLRKVTTGKGGRFVGRPKQSFKARVNPFTGQLVRMPALPYYKLVRKYNQMLRGRATGFIQMQQAQLARRGVPPSIAAQILAQRQAQAVEQVQQQPQQQQVQQQYPQQQMPQEQVQYVERPASAMRQRTIRMPFQRPVQVAPRQMPIPEPQYKPEIDIMTGKPRLAPNWAGRREKWTVD